MLFFPLELRNRDLPVFDLRDCTNLRVLNIQSIYLGCSMSNIQELLPLATSAVQNIISSVPNPALLEEIRIRFEIDLSEFEAMADMANTSTTALPLVSDDADSVPFMDQFARFQWAEFSKFLLGIPSPGTPAIGVTSDPKSASKHDYSLSHIESESIPLVARYQPLHSPRSKRVHIELGAYPFENKLFEDIFVKNYDEYVKYIYENGLNLVEKGGNELVFSQVQYSNSYEVDRLR